MFNDGYYCKAVHDKLRVFDQDQPRRLFMSGMDPMVTAAAIKPRELRRRHVILIYKLRGREVVVKLF